MAKIRHHQLTTPHTFSISSQTVSPTLDLNWNPFKMVSKTVIFAVIVPLLCFIKSSSGELKCYSCQEFLKLANPRNVASSSSSSSSSSDNVVPCGELTDNEIMTCAPNQDACLKTLVPTGPTGERFIYRRCGLAKECETMNGNIQCFSCKGNKCNGSSSLTVAVLLFALPAVLFTKMH